MRSILSTARLTVALFGLVMPVTAVVVGTAAPAVASPADCLNGANGFVPVPDSVADAGSIAGRPVTPDVTVELIGGTIDEKRVWARVRGANPTGSQFWLDWTRDNGQTWIRCGPFRAGSTEDTRRTPAQHRGEAGAFRACVPLPASKDPYDCTPWTH